MTIRIVLADDHAIIRTGLQVLLDSQEDINVVGIANNGREAVQLVEQHRPDVAVLDISMPELNGIDAVQQMLQRHPPLRAIMLSIHATKPYILRALRAGASGYLLKETAGLEVLDAVRAVMRGERYLSERIADILMDTVLERRTTTDEPASPLDSLSPREREVLQLVAEGMTSQEIGEKLSVSSKSIDTYRSRLMKKIGVSDLAALIRFAIQHGVISID